MTSRPDGRLRRVVVLCGLSLLAAFVATLAVGSVAGASSGSPELSRQFGPEQIVSFRTTIEVSPDGSAQFTEVIDYDFGSTSRRGIFRKIPTRFPWSGAAPSDAVPGATFDRVTPIEDISVVASGDTPDDVEVTDESGTTQIRIGDPDITITGRHTYTIRYRLVGVANAFGDYDEVYLNTTGDEWEVPILDAQATVRMPGGIERVACFAGPRGSQLPCQSATPEGSNAKFSNGVLDASSGLTVVVGVPKGVLIDPVTTRVIEERWSPRTAFRATPATVGGGIAVLVAGLAGLGVLGWRRGRDRRYAGGVMQAAFGNADGSDEPVPLGRGDANPVEFVPPDGIRPGHLGTLWDEEAHHLDVSAMIVDLAVRGYLRIDEVGDPGHGRDEIDHQFVRLRPAEQITAGGALSRPGLESLAPAESVLLSGLFRDGDVIQLSSLKEHFAERMALVQSSLYDDVVAAGWFPTRPDRVRQRWAWRGLGLTVLGGAVAFAVARWTHLGLVALPLPFLGLLLAGAARTLPARAPRGTAMLGRVRGFKELFDAGEGERQRFAEDHGAFARYLPYAIVFGCTEQWAQTFADLGVSPQEMGLGGWYTSPYGYNPYQFGWVMGSFTTRSTGSLAAATPSSSGGASSGGSGFSGGFSGGGFGGGGGGSW